eukprot:jgi/Botrbrau1/18476/Bobra.0072s0058.1
MYTLWHAWHVRIQLLVCTYTVKAMHTRYRLLMYTYTVNAMHTPCMEQEDFPMVVAVQDAYTHSLCITSKFLTLHAPISASSVASLACIQGLSLLMCFQFGALRESF